MQDKIKSFFMDLCQKIVFETLTDTPSPQYFISPFTLPSSPTLQSAKRQLQPVCVEPVWGNLEKKKKSSIYVT